MADSPADDPGQRALDLLKRLYDDARGFWYTDIGLSEIIGEEVEAEIKSILTDAGLLTDELESGR